MYSIKLLPIAELNLKEIYDYLFLETNNREISENMIKKIYEKFIYLKLFPNMYQNTYKDFKTIQIKSYKIFYKVNETKKQIIIYRILGASRNFREYI